jgi:AraC family transcriptional regulator
MSSGEPFAHRRPGECFGRIATRRDTVGVSAVDVYHPPHARYGEHVHEAPFFSLVIDGAYRELVGSQERICRSFSVAFCAAGFQHRNDIGPSGARLFEIELEPLWVSSLAALHPGAATVSADVRDPRAFGALLQLHREFCHAGTDGRPMDAFAVEVLTSELIGHALERPAWPERRYPAWLGRVVDCVDAHATHALRVGMLADIAGVHPVHLARVFRQTYRCSIAEYQTMVRIRRACAMLGEGELSLAQIALRTGFADQSHFTRAFTATVGWSPGAFRRVVFPDVRDVRAHVA